MSVCNKAFALRLQLVIWKKYDSKEKNWINCTELKSSQCGSAWCRPRLNPIKQLIGSRILVPKSFMALLGVFSHAFGNKNYFSMLPQHSSWLSLLTICNHALHSWTRAREEYAGLRPWGLGSLFRSLRVDGPEELFPFEKIVCICKLMLFLCDFAVIFFFWCGIKV